MCSLVLAGAIGVDVSIDMHDMPFYAKCVRLIYAVKSRSKDGAHTFNRLATIHCATAGQRLTLGMVVVVRRQDETADVVGRLLERCSKKGIVIASLTMDLGFYSVSVINAVKKRGVSAVMPAVKTSRVKTEIRARDSGEKGAVIAHEISSGKDSASYTLIILKREKKKLAIDDEELKVLDELYGNKDDDGKDKVVKKYYVFATTMDGEWMREGGDPYAIAQFYKRAGESKTLTNAMNRSGPAPPAPNIRCASYGGFFRSYCKTPMDTGPLFDIPQDGHTRYGDLHPGGICVVYPGCCI